MDGRKDGRKPKHLLSCQWQRQSGVLGGLNFFDFFIFSHNGHRGFMISFCR